MIRVFLLFFLMFLSLNAEDLRIKSKFFVYNSEKNLSIFTDDVNVTKGKDNILSDKLIVFFDENRKPLKFEAEGHVKFFISLDENSTYKGYSNKLIYFFKKGDIILIGNAFILNVDTNESVKGDRILLNRITKSANVEGKNKPIEIILKVKE